MLRSKGILKSSMRCPGKGSAACGRSMKETKRKTRCTIWRCTKRSCGKELSLRTGCSFLSFKTRSVCHKSNLPLTEVLEIVWLWLFTKATMRDAAQASGHNYHTIVRWWEMCRLVCTGILDSEPKFVGTDSRPVQIDESYFAGRRKYNRGRLRHGDSSRNGDDDDELEEWNERTMTGRCLMMTAMIGLGSWVSMYLMRRYDLFVYKIENKKHCALLLRSTSKREASSGLTVSHLTTTIHWMGTLIK